MKEESEPTVYTSGDYRYILLPDGTAEITKYTGKDAVLSIPAQLDGYAVTSIGAAAFFYCYALTEITLPEGLTSIGDSAFSSCGSLTEITLPDSVTEMGRNPFAGCSKLTQIKVSPDHAVFAAIDGVLFHKQEKKLVIYPKGKPGETYAVPQGIAAIGEYAFSHCYGLKEITLPEELTSIGDSAFSSCHGLKEITLPEGLTSIGDRAFSSCGSLAKITLPEGLTSIGDYAFDSCESLTEITLPAGLTSIGDDAFYFCEGLTEIVIPDSVTAMGVNPFAGCSKLTQIKVSPDHAVFAAIDGVLFHKQEKKMVSYPEGKPGETYAVPQGIAAIGDYAFSTCEGLMEITLPEGLTSIGEDAFLYCESLTAITLPETLAVIGKNAFNGCPEDALFTVIRDSYGAKWCKENGKEYTYTDANDWLLN